MSVELVNQAFESLFFGTGSYLGLLLFITICVGLLKKWKYSSALIIPVIMGLETMYFNRLDTSGNYIWHIFILLCLAIFSGLWGVFGKDEKY